jgi:hypothetical protein
VQTDDKGKKPMFTDRAREMERKQKEKKNWEPPGTGKIKVNVDGAFVEDGTAGFRVVIRDEKGNALLSAWEVINNAASAEEVKLALMWSPKPTILESDCSTAIKLLVKPDDQRSPSVFIVRNTIQVAEGLPSIVFKHVKREQNSVAHELAQLSRRLSHSAYGMTGSRFVLSI